jgi:predicted transcriptional regulator
MQSSLLSDYIEVIKSLLENGPQTSSQMNSFFRNPTPAVLKKAIEFLSENKIISEETTNANLRYAITDRGIGILKFFKVMPSNAIIKMKP